MKQILLSQLGVQPDFPGDCTRALAEALARVPDGSEVHFAPGVYRFSAGDAFPLHCALSNSDQVPERRASILLEGRSDLALDGGGATLLCHGQTTPLALLDCHNIRLKRFVIDWDIPLVAEGKITQVADDHLDVAIDPERYPFHIQERALWFDGGDWQEPLWSWGHTEFDPAAQALAYRRGDAFPPTEQSLLPSGEVRFTGDFAAGESRPAVGNTLVLRHGRREHAGLLIHHCSQVAVDELTMYANGGLGVLTQFSDTLQFSRVYIGPNREAGRQFAGGHDDGIHLSANSGTVSITDCSFLGLMDDPVNLHGIAAKAEQQLNDDTFRGRFMHPQSIGHTLWAEPGQTVAFLDGDTMQELCTAQVTHFALTAPDSFTIRFDRPIRLDTASLSLENLSRTASLVCRGNRFGSCRARGLLVCTPQPVLVEHNRFESAGAAIRIAGDVCTWYESGRCQEVLIQNNEFAATCLTSNYEGGEGIISISPELPHPLDGVPCHHGIVIRDNTFTTGDRRLIYARCTDGLQVLNNRVVHSTIYPEGGAGAKPVTLEHCTHTVIRGNSFEEL